MALGPGQAQIRDLVIGPGTRYEVGKGTNWLGFDVRADAGGPRGWGHGGWSGAEWLDRGVLPLRINILATSEADWLTHYDELAQALRPVGDSTDPVEMRFTYGGREFLRYIRPRGIDPDMDNASTGFSQVRAGVAVLDPFRYDGSESTAGPISMAQYTGGLTVPITVPVTINATRVGGGANLTNAGTADTGLTLRIDGPLSEPYVTLLPAGGTPQTLRFDLDLTSGQWLIVDTAARTVSLNGDTEASRRGQTSGDFFLLPAGTSEIRFAAADYNTGTLTVTWRSAWW